MKKLRNKIIGIVLGAVAAVFVLMAGALYAVMVLYTIRQADLMTQVICENNGSVPVLIDEEGLSGSYPMGFNEESAYRTRYFIVYLDQYGEVSYMDMDYIAAVGDEDAQEMAAEVLESNRTTGFSRGYRYRISRMEDDTPAFIVFLDYSEDQTAAQGFLGVIGIVFISFIVLLSVVFIFCSRYVLKPFEENSRRQKQFVTDASHELKTPLAIISANAEVLEYKNGKNEWTQTIREETKHMSSLINDLLTLSRLQEVDNTYLSEQIQLSALVEQEAEKFREAIERKACRFAIDVQAGVRVSGNKEQMAQMVATLLENAAKYVTEGGSVKVELGTSGKNAVLKIFNTAELSEDFDGKRLFERFYRLDSSRSSETGGHGIGLSIARRITECHSGSISAERSGDGIEFTVTLPTEGKRR